MQVCCWNEMEQCLTRRRLMTSPQALWFSIFLWDWPLFWEEGPGELMALDSPAGV